MSNLVDGFNVVGLCKGINTSQNGQYVNNDLVIGVRQPDGFGGTVESLQYIGMFGDSLNRIQAQINTCKGKLIAVSVVVRSLKSERTGNAYQKVSTHQNSSLLILNDENQLKKVG